LSVAETGHVVLIAAKRLFFGVEPEVLVSGGSERAGSVPYLSLNEQNC
jgi:hypothetical protein